MNFKILKRLLVFGVLSIMILPSFAMAEPSSLSVVNISTDDKPGYAIYWPKDAGKVSLERAAGESAFSVIAETELNYFADFSVEKGVTYNYRVNVKGETLTGISTDDAGGRPAVSNIKIESGSVGKSEASVIVTFSSDRLAQNQIFYGETADYGNQTEVDNSLNQNHTVLIEKLRPNTTYHFKVRAIDRSGTESTESEDQTFTTPPVPKEQTILEIIIEALTQAFSGFQKWLKG